MLAQVSTRPLSAARVRRASRLTLTPVTYALLLAAGCTSLRPAPPGWTRESYTERRGRCVGGACTTVVRTARGSVVVWTRAREYDRHQIPGWDTGSVAARRTAAVLQSIFRQFGGTTDRVRVGVGRRVVTDTAGGGWRLTCSAYWIDDLEIEKDEDGEEVARRRRRTQGLDCRAVAQRDTSVVLWRLRLGVAPPLDSLASVYDSLAAARSPLVSANPPLSLERFATDGRAAAHYEVTPESPSALERPTLAQRVGLIVQLSVRRESGGPLIATLHQSLAPGYGRGSLDLGPDVGEEEARMLRLLAVTLRLPFAATE